MKFSTMAAVLAVALAMVTTGCRYDKAKKGAGDADANASDIATEGAQEMDLSSVGEKRFEDLYQKCTDVELTPVYFGFDASTIRPDQMASADAVVEHLNSHPTRVVVVEGNCDERGSDEYNVMLGDQRASVVRDYLTANGIAANRIQTRSYGETKPAVDGHDEAAWAKNRRDEFGVYDSAKAK